jgi:WD40 repeat protein
MRILTGRDVYINSLRFSSDGRFLASDGYTPILRYWFVDVWDLRGEARSKRTTEGQLKSGDGFTPDNRKLQFTQNNRRIALSLATGKVASDVPRLDMDETSPNRQWAVSHENDFLAGVHRLRAVHRVGRRRVERWTREFPRTPTPTGDAFDGEEASFNRLGFAVNGTRILVVYRRYDHHGIDEFLQAGGRPADYPRGRSDHHAFEQEIVRVLDTETGQDVTEWRGEPSVLSGPNGELLDLRRSSFRVVNTLKPDQPAITRTNPSSEEYTAAAFSPDGKLLATTCSDTTVTLWDTATWQPVRRHGCKIGRLRAVAFAPDGLTCAAGSDSGQVVLFDVDV